MDLKMSMDELAANLRKPEGENGLAVAEFMNKGNSNFYNQLVKNVLWKDGMKVLEIGIGNAKHVPEILKQAINIEYVGVDYSETMINEAKKNNPNQAFYCQDVCDLNLDQKFDLIYTINTVYFIDDLTLFATKLKNHLAPNGQILIGKRPKEDMEKLDSVTKYNFIKYSNEEVVKAVMSSGLDISKVVSSKDPEFERNGEKVVLHSDFIIAHGN